MKLILPTLILAAAGATVWLLWPTGASPAAISTGHSTEVRKTVPARTSQVDRTEARPNIPNDHHPETQPAGVSKSPNVASPQRQSASRRSQEGARTLDQPPIQAGSGPGTGTRSRGNTFDYPSSQQAARPTESAPELLPGLIVPFSLTNPTQPAGIPAILTLNPGTIGATEDEKAGLNQLAAEFLDKVASGSQDPGDPAYQKLWMDAAAQSDAQLRTRYGGERWLRQHADAYREALGNTAAAAESP